MEKIPVKMAPRLTENWRTTSRCQRRAVTVDGGYLRIPLSRFFCWTWSEGKFYEPVDQFTKVCVYIASGPPIRLKSSSSLDQVNLWYRDEIPAFLRFTPKREPKALDVVRPVSSRAIGYY